MYLVVKARRGPRRLAGVGVFLANATKDPEGDHRFEAVKVAGAGNSTREKYKKSRPGVAGDERTSRVVVHNIPPCLVGIPTSQTQRCHMYTRILGRFTPDTTSPYCRVQPRRKRSIDRNLLTRRQGNKLTFFFFKTRWWWPRRHEQDREGARPYAARFSFRWVARSTRWMLVPLLCRAGRVIVQGRSASGMDIENLRAFVYRGQDILP